MKKLRYVRMDGSHGEQDGAVVELSPPTLVRIRPRAIFRLRLLLSPCLESFPSLQLDQNRKPT